MDLPQWKTACCNPFEKPKHPSKKNLRPVLPWMCERLPSLTLGAKICDDCRKKLVQIAVPVSAPEELASFETSQDDPRASSHRMSSIRVSPWNL